MTRGGGGGGIPLSFERGRTSKNRLKIDWDYPASIEIEQKDDGKTRAVARMYALELGKAFERLSGDDPRPLLVMRECNRCKGTDDALLSRTLNNEKTLMLTRWFHCVKLKNHVLETDHTFHQLFKGKRPPHLFVSSADGSNMTPLPGTQPQSELWKVMHKLLGKEYERDVNQAVKEIFKLFAVYDSLDSMEDQLKEQVDAEIEKRGPKSPKVKRLKQKLSTLEQKKNAARAREQELADLSLKQKPEVADKPAK